MKVLMVEIFGRGGLAHYVFNLASELARSGANICIVTAAEYELESLSLPSGAVVSPNLSRLAFRLRGLLPDSMLRLIKVVEFPASSVSVFRVVRNWKPDVIHLHCTSWAILLLLVFLKPLGVPLVYTAHNVIPHESSGFHEAIFKVIYRMSDHIIVHSVQDRKLLSDKFGVEDAVSVVPQGNYCFLCDEPKMVTRIQARSILAIEQDADVALFFGFLRENKGLNLLLTAWPEVCKVRPTARLLIAGYPNRMNRKRFDQLPDGLGG